MTRSTGLEGPARAKVNLDLRVLARRPDGYHDIDTLFARVALHDTVAVTPHADETIELIVDGDAGGAVGPENLAHRAASLLSAHTGGSDGVRIHLTKRIPAGAGLGGGSADAAATLELCNRLWGEPATRSELVRLGSTLGADVAFLVSGYEAAWGTGRGDVLEEAALPGAASIVLALPEIHVNTAEAYARLARTRQGEGTVMSSTRPEVDVWRALGDQCVNDFEAVVHEWFPSLRRLHRSLVETAPVLARMSGSGAAHFAVYEDTDGADSAIRSLTKAHPGVRFVQSHFE